jgi:hypothetical protein
MGLRGWIFSAARFKIMRLQSRCLGLQYNDKGYRHG